MILWGGDGAPPRCRAPFLGGLRLLFFNSRPKASDGWREGEPTLRTYSVASGSLRIEAMSDLNLAWQSTRIA